MLQSYMYQLGFSPCAHYNLWFHHQEREGRGLPPVTRQITESSPSLSTTSSSPATRLWFPPPTVSRGRPGGTGGVKYSMFLKFRHLSPTENSPTTASSTQVMTVRLRWKSARQRYSPASPVPIRMKSKIGICFSGNSRARPGIAPLWPATMGVVH